MPRIPILSWLTAGTILLSACAGSPFGVSSSPELETAGQATSPPIPEIEEQVETEEIEITGSIDLTSTPASKNGDADVVFVRAERSSDGTWTFHVTVAHADTGWEDYANGWDVLLPDGTVLKNNPGDPFTRLLLHPHETEQPFTRSQGGLEIPTSVQTVTVRAHDLVDGFGGEEIEVDLTASAGPGFEVNP